MNKNEQKFALQNGLLQFTFLRRLRGCFVDLGRGSNPDENGAGQCEGQQLPIKRQKEEIARKMS